MMLTSVTVYISQIAEELCSRRKGGSGRKTEGGGEEESKQGEQKRKGVEDLVGQEVKKMPDGVKKTSAITRRLG